MDQKKSRQHQMRLLRLARQHDYLAGLMGPWDDAADQRAGYVPEGEFPRSDAALAAANRHMGRAIELLASSNWW